MPSISKWLSVLQPAGESVVLNVTVKTMNDSVEGTPTSRTTNITLSNGSTETSTAAQIANALNTDWAANNINFDGTPAFEVNGIPYPFRLRAEQVGHLVNIWSETNFDLSISFSGQTKAFIVSESVPVFPTFATAKRFGPLYGATFCTRSGDPFTPQQLADALLLGSSELIEIGGGSPLVACQYLDEFTVDFLTDGFNLSNYPIIRWDTPAVSSPFFYQLTGSTVVTMRKFFNVDQLGCVKFIGLTSYFRRVLLTTQRLTIKMSYTAGHPSIDPFFVKQSVRAAALLNAPFDIYERIQSETGVVQFRDSDKRVDQVRMRLAEICGW